jgi:ribosome-binding factor A
MLSPSLRQKKRAQKEKLLLREISNLFLQAATDDSELHGMFINRVELSEDKSVCTVYFYTDQGKQFFDEKCKRLKLYKPSFRKALADRLKFRYTPDLRFAFDIQYEKQISIEKLLDKIGKESKS